MWRLFIILLSIMAVSTILWFNVGVRFADIFFEPWATFRVPKDAGVLATDIAVSGRDIQICNRSSQQWKGTLIQLNGSFLAELGRLQSSECRHLNVKDFAYPSWKKLPPPNDLVPRKVEVLASSEGMGYASRSF
jgi:hypothetical protein